MSRNLGAWTKVVSAVGTIFVDPPRGPGRALISASGSYLWMNSGQSTACPHTPPVRRFVREPQQGIQDRI
jgi:hypothetical protein